MNTYITWSGERARAVAQAIRTQLLLTVPGLDVYTSTQDLRVGVDWMEAIQKHMKAADCAVMVVTVEGLRSNWLYFEIGFLASLNIPIVPVLVGVPRDLVPTALRQYQCLTVESGSLSGLYTAHSLAAEDANREAKKLAVAIDSILTKSSSMPEATASTPLSSRFDKLWDEALETSEVPSK